MEVNDSDKHASLLRYRMEHFEKQKQLFESKITIYLDTSVAQNLIYTKMLFILSTPVVIAYLWQMNTLVFLHRCLIQGVILFEAVKSSITLPLGANFINLFYKWAK